ncbi:MAG: HD domain-containing protein [Candidatus Bathyarchaeia archaeon]
MSEKFWGEIKDPVHGYVYISEVEKEVLDTYPVQRLRRLRQLAGSEYVYPGANHSRFEHSVGVLYLSKVLLQNPNLSRNISNEEASEVKVAAILHDVGHGPFSHVYEHLLEKFLSKTHEDLTKWVITKSELGDKLRNLGFSPDRISRLAVGEMHERGKEFLDQIVRSALDVDKMDFIVRDTYHTGAEYGFVDIHRLLMMLDVLGGNLALDEGALSAFESFILARVESFKSIYFHRTSRAVQIMLAQAMERAKDELGLLDFEDVESYLAKDDYTTWSMLKKSESASETIRRLERRDLLRCAYEKTLQVRDRAVSSLFSREEIRRNVEEEIAREANVDPASIVIDVPNVPSVPYRHSILLEPMEIPLFRKMENGGKTPIDLSEVSEIFNALKGFVNIIRIYTEGKYRSRVRESAEKILGDMPFSARVSF